jgi:hypothetical protein
VIEVALLTNPKLGDIIIAQYKMIMLLWLAFIVAVIGCLLVLGDGYVGIIQKADTGASNFQETAIDNR